MVIKESWCVLNEEQIVEACFESKKEAEKYLELYLKEFPYQKHRGTLKPRIAHLRIDI